MSELCVFWGSELVGRLSDTRSGLAFAYEALDSPMISLAMPPTRRPYDDDKARPFFHGLLPEGEARRIIAHDLGFRTDGGTDFEMLAALGADCAGALVITEHDRPPSPGEAGEPVRIGDDDIAKKLRELPFEPLGVTGEVRVSLTGMQPKLPLTQLPDGSWALPSPQRPSTHILKPPSQTLPDSVPNEVFCMKLAAALGVDAAPTELATFDGVPALVSTRYDRHIGTDGSVSRLHQEDGCQALSILVAAPPAKYQRDGRGPSFAALASLLDQWGPARSRYELVDHLFVAMAVGNADFHAKNVSFLYEPGGVRLAPMYDVMSTAGLTIYSGQEVSSTLGMAIGNATDVDEVAIADLIDEAESWRLRRPNVEQRIARLADALPEAIESAADAVATMGEERLELVLGRSEKLRSQGASLGISGLDVSLAEPAITQGSGRVRPYRRKDGTPVRGHDRRPRT